MLSPFSENKKLFLRKLKLFLKHLNLKKDKNEEKNQNIIMLKLNIIKLNHPKTIVKF